MPQNEVPKSKIATLEKMNMNKKIKLLNALFPYLKNKIQIKQKWINKWKRKNKNKKI